MQSELRNSKIYLDFTQNPSLSDALADKNVGDKCTAEVTFEIISKDLKGIDASIAPGDVTPEGYEAEEPKDTNVDTTPAPPPPGSFATAPVTVAMNLRKKGK